MKNIIFLLIALTFVTFIASCDSSTKTEDSFSGITQTKEDGTIISTDPDDWKSAGCSGSVCLISNILFRANPVKSTAGLTLTVSKSLKVDIGIYSFPETKKKTIQNAVLMAGTHDMNVNVSGLAAGIYRIIIIADDNGTTYRTYGDIQVIE
jgi:hypothetical protein